MSRRTKKPQPLPQPERATYPAVIDHLARAFRAGENCGPGLHDALLEAGHPGLAGHFAGDCACRPGTRCLAVEEILHPRAPDREDPTGDWSRSDTNPPRRQGYGEDHKDLTADYRELCRALEVAGVARAEVSYNGCGDSGAVETITLFDRKGKEVDAASLPAQPLVAGGSGPGKKLNLADRLDELVCAILPGGWEINEGSFGTVTLNALTRRIYVGHSWRIETTNEEAFEHDL